MTEPSLCEKCPNTELFLFPIFLYSDWIRRVANLRIQPEYGKIRSRNNSVFGHFSRSVIRTTINHPLCECVPFNVQENIKDYFFLKKAAGYNSWILYVKEICQPYPTNIYWFKVNNRNTRKRCKIWSKLTIKIPVLASSLLTLNIFLSFFIFF